MVRVRSGVVAHGLQPRVQVMTPSWQSVHRPPWYHAPTWDVLDIIGLTHLWVSDSGKEVGFPIPQTWLWIVAQKTCVAWACYFLSPGFHCTSQAVNRDNNTHLRGWDQTSASAQCWACCISGGCAVRRVVPTWLGSFSFCALSPILQVFLKGKHCFILFSLSTPRVSSTLSCISQVSDNWKL